MVRQCDVGKDGCGELNAWLSSLLQCSQVGCMGPGWAAHLCGVLHSKVGAWWSRGGV